MNIPMNNKYPVRSSVVSNDIQYISEKMCNTIFSAMIE